MFFFKINYTFSLYSMCINLKFYFLQKKNNKLNISKKNLKKSLKI